MSKIAGLALILAGVAAAAYVLPTSDDRGANEAQSSDVRSAQASGPFSGQSTGQTPQIATATVQPPLIVPQPIPAVRSEAAKSATPKLPDVPQKQVLETAAIMPRAANPSEATMPVPVARKLASAKPTDEAARLQLTRDIQSELKRIGCFDGEANGEWTPATKKGMKAFIERINATLPIEEPDHILKTLVQGHPGSACGKTCPAGQSLNGDRCVPSAILAQQQAVKRRVPTSREAATSTASAPRLAQPKATSQWETTVTAMAPLPIPAPRATEKQEPLAGRMALAGPNTETTTPSSPWWPKPAVRVEQIEKPSESTSETDRGPRSTRVAALPSPKDENDDAPEGKPAAKPKAEPRPASRATAPASSYAPPRPPRTVVYSAPVYSPPRRERSAFNVSIFQRLAREGR